MTAGPRVRAAATELLKAAADSAVEVEAKVEVLSKPHRGRGGGSEARAWFGKLGEVGAHTSSYHRKGALATYQSRVFVKSCHVIETGENRDLKKKALRLA